MHSYIRRVDSQQNCELTARAAPRPPWRVRSAAADSTGIALVHDETPPPLTDVVRLAGRGSLDRMGGIAVAAAGVGLEVFGVASEPAVP